MKLRLRSVAPLLLALVAAGCAGPADEPADPTPSTSTPAGATPPTGTSGTPATSTPPATTTTPATSTPPAEPGQEPCESLEEPRFTHDVTDLSLAQGIIPPGNLAGMAVVKSHSHVVPVATAGGGFARMPVYAPVDAKLDRIAYYEEQGSALYQIFLTTDCGVFFQLDHLAEVSDRIRALAPAQPQPTSANVRVGPLPVQGGELLGWSDNASISGRWDFGVYDPRTAPAYANPARHPGERDAHAVCPYDRYDGEKRAAYQALYARADGTPVTGADCRGASRDVNGTMAGQWFRGQGTNEQPPHMAIAADFDSTVFVQIHVVGEAPVDVRDATTSSEPHETTVGQEACWQDASGHVAARLVSATSLLVAHGSGPCPAAFPADRAVEWVR